MEEAVSGTENTLAPLCGREAKYGPEQFDTWARNSELPATSSLSPPNTLPR